MTSVLERRVLAPQRYRGRPRIMSADEELVYHWLNTAGYQPAHERMFYPFSYRRSGSLYGFSPDLRVTVDDQPVVIEVCVADRYPVPPSGTNKRKWAPPEVKHDDKLFKLSQLVSLYGVPGILLTAADIEYLQSLRAGARSRELKHRLAVAIEAANLQAVAV